MTAGRDDRAEPVGFDAALRAIVTALAIAVLREVRSRQARERDRPRSLLTLGQACRAIHRSRSAILRGLHAGEIQGRHTTTASGGRWDIDQASLIAWQGRQRARTALP